MSTYDTDFESGRLSLQSHDSHRTRHDSSEHNPKPRVAPDFPDAAASTGFSTRNTPQLSIQNGNAGTPSHDVNQAESQIVSTPVSSLSNYEPIHAGLASVLAMLSVPQSLKSPPSWDLLASERDPPVPVSDPASNSNINLNLTVSFNPQLTTIITGGNHANRMTVRAPAKDVRSCGGSLLSRMVGAVTTGFLRFLCFVKLRSTLAQPNADEDLLVENSAGALGSPQSEGYLSRGYPIPPCVLQGPLPAMWDQSLLPCFTPQIP